MSFNTAKIINVYYKADRKPYDANGKPISYFGEDFNGANEATEIRFYMPEGVDLGAVDCVAEVKRPNGDKRFDLLTKITNGDGTYYRLVTNAWYNQYVGKVTIAFKAYFGGVTIVDGVITATTGAIYVSDIFHLQIAYAPSSTEPVPPFDPTDVTTFINALSQKLNVNNGIFVIASALPTLTGGVYDGQWFLVKNNTDGEQGRLYYIDGSTAIAVELELGKLKLTPTGNGDLTTNTGKLNWEQPNGTIQMGLYNDVNVGLGEDVFYYGKASANITKGQAIQFAGYQGDHLLIKPAVPSEINANPKLIMGIAKHNITSGDFGYVLHFGKLDGFDTGSFVAGNLLWFASGSGNNGELTATKPTAPNAKILMCAVIKAETSGPANNGVVQVRITIEPSIGELQDVNVSSVADNEILRYNSATSRWENTTDLTTAETDIDNLEARMTTAEGDIDSLEGRMTTAEGDIDDIEDGTTVVPKALGDQNGDTINTTYLKIASASSTYVPLSSKGVANGVAPLGSDNKIPSIHLPGGVDDIKEFPDLASFPLVGEASIIYVALDTNIIYRWGGSSYVEISSSLALGETSSTAFAGNRGVALETLTTNIVNGTQALSLKDQVIRNTAVGTIPLTVNGVASTTANLTEFQVDGTRVLEVTKDGFLTQNGTRLFHQTGGDTNTFFGNQSGTTSVTGTLNTGFGRSALEKLTSGSGNTAFGRTSLFNLTTSNNNTAVGVSVLLNTNGTGNTGLGYGAGVSNTTGTLNTFVGFNAGNDASQLATATNSTALGNAAYTDKSNQMVFGNSSVTEFKFDRNASAIALLPQVNATSSSAHEIVGTTSDTNNVGVSLNLLRSTSGDMVDGFGYGIAFAIRDNANVINSISRIQGIRSGADNSGRLAFLTNNAGSITEKMTILPNGNVGIGTSSPASLLEVSGTGTQFIRVTSTNGSPSGIYLQRGTGADFSQDIQLLNSAGALRIETINGTTPVTTTRMIITDTGNVGIGTSAPAQLLSLNTTSNTNGLQIRRSSVAGNDSYAKLGFRISDTENAVDFVELRATRTNRAVAGDTDLSFHTYTNNALAERMRIRDDGNVGIGTSSPAQLLEVSQALDGTTLRITSRQNDSSHSGATPFGILEFYSDDTSGAGAGNRGSIGVYPVATSGAGGAMRFFTNDGTSNSERMTIRENGLVGINADAPSAQLQVKSGATTRVPLIVDTLTSGHTANIVEFNANNSIRFSVGADGLIRTTNGIANMNSANNSRINIGSSGTTIQRDIADTNPALIVNLANSSATGNIQVWQKAGSAVSAVDKDGLVRTAGIYSINVGFNNGNMTFGSNGPVIRRNIADSNPALIVDLQNSSSTGNILVLQNAGSSVASFSNSGIFVGQSRPTQTEITANATLALADEGKVLRVNSSSNLTITVPLNSSVAFPIDTEIAILRYGTGTVSISPTSGVTLNSKNSERKISGQYGSVALKKIGTDEWVLVGSLEA